MTHERLGAGLTQGLLRVFLHLSFRPLLALGGQAQPVEHAAHLLGNLLDGLDHPLQPLVEGDTAPFGIVLRRIGALVIRRHVLGPVARQSADKAVLASEVVAAVMQV